MGAKYQHRQDSALGMRVDGSAPTCSPRDPPRDPPARWLACADASRGAAPGACAAEMGARVHAWAEARRRTH